MRPSYIAIGRPPMGYVAVLAFAVPRPRAERWERTVRMTTDLGLQ
jgi:hypothetical protein